MNTYTFSDLTKLALPDSIALIGASEKPESIGGRTLDNIVQHSQYKGRLHLVNPTRLTIHDRPCFPSVSAIDDPIDVALVTVRADHVLPSLRECAAKGVKFAIIQSSGFGEVDEEGKRMEQEMLSIARASGMRIYGPNCPGLNNINARLGMTFSPAFKLDQMPGPIGLATQGGGMGRTVLQAMARGMGTGLWFSAGNEVDLEVSDFIHYMATASDIKVIAANIEGVRNGPKFLEACQHAARQGKPVVALKIGKSEYGAKAAASHTAAISGSAEVNSAVFKELGVVEVNDIDELIDTAALLAHGKPTGKEKIAVFSYSGGTAAFAADQIGAGDLELSTFDESTLAKLRDCLPSFAAMNNPVDTTGAVLADPEIGYRSLKAIADDADVGMVFYPIPFDYGRDTEIAAQNAVRVNKEITKPLVMAWMSDKRGLGHQVLVDGGIVPAASMTNAVHAMKRFIEYGQWQSSVDAAWVPSLLNAKPAHEGAIRTATEAEGKALLREFGVRVPSGVVVQDRDAAAQVFRTLEKAAVVMKIVSSHITHKSDIGGVKLHIASPEQAQTAFDDIAAAFAQHAPGIPFEGVLVEEMQTEAFVEVVVGIHRDPVFGHVCTFGLGGVSMELYKDVSRRLLPLTAQRAREMIDETHCAQLLKGYRGKPAMDVDALVQTLVALSDLVTERSDELDELEINPLAVLRSGRGVVALDAVLTLRDKE
ncbi:acetate--CoA ligase family protein [Diaphorobacter caeni]|uniref:acetate--CoA ligase family protein n=1 Tax=Diaphorobacter caeni TaxID=2784387 RepID=UPI00188FB9AE|nr:acetate--CoA ligase family protein [Diaphorobacter caeni]MBF5007296.1 acetate--CoA ligase family protein [Diaphorobacter caeni]